MGFFNMITLSSMISGLEGITSFEVFLTDSHSFTNFILEFEEVLVSKSLSRTNLPTTSG